MNFKIIMLAIAGIALTQTAANAQTSKKKECDKRTVVVSQSGKEKSNLMATYELKEEKVGKKKASCEITYVRYEATSNKHNPRLKVAYDMPGDVYEGKEVLSNDGVANNMNRNINYLDFSNPKVPNDGGVMYQK